MPLRRKHQCKLWILFRLATLCLLIRSTLQQFTIQCSRNGGDEAFSAFIATVKNYIEVESKRNEDEDKSELVRYVYLRVVKLRADRPCKQVKRVERIPETVLKDPEYTEVDSINSLEDISRGPTQQTSDKPHLDLLSVASDEKEEAEEEDDKATIPAMFRGEQDSQLIGIMHNKTITRTWKPSNWTESITSLLCSETIAKVTKLTRCRIQPAPEQRSIVLTGEADEAVERAMSKLAVLIEASVSTRPLQHYLGLPIQYSKDSGVLFFDFQIAEKEIDTRLQFIPLKKDTRRLRTTLISPGSPYTGILPDLLVLVLLKRDIDHRFVVIVDQKRKRLQSLNKDCRIWPPEYEHKPHGHVGLILTNSTLASTSSSGDRSIIHEQLPRSITALVERWREEVTVPSVHGSHTAVTNTQLEQESGRGLHSGNTFMKPATPQKRTYGLKRVPKGMPAPERTEQSVHHSELSSAAASSENVLLRPSSANSIGGSFGFRATAPAASVSMSQLDSFAAVEGDQASHNHNRDGSPNARLPGIPNLARSPEANNIVALISTRSVASTTLAHGNITPTGPPAFGSSAQLPTRSLGGSEQESSPTQSENSNPLWRTRVMQSERTGDLLDFSDVTQRPSSMRSRMPVQARTATRRSEIRRPVSQRIEGSRSGKTSGERLQIANEIGSRTAKHTMNQQKLASGEGAAKGDAAVTKGFEAAATNVLKLARSYNGIVTLEVDIGRILIRPQDVAQDYRKSLFTADEWSSVFPSGHEAGFRETLFLNM